MAKKIKKKKKVKKKKWFTICSPKVFGKNPFAETIAKEKKELKGRIIDTQLSNITRDMSKQNIKLKLKIDNVENEKAQTKIIQYELSRPYIQRMVRKRINKIEVVDDIKLKNNKKYRVKTTGITLKKCSVAQKKALRKSMSEEVKKSLKSFDIGSLVIALSTNKIQRNIKNKVSKIYPLRFLDVVKVKELKEKEDVVKSTKEETKEKKVEEKGSKEEDKSKEVQEKSKEEDEEVSEEVQENNKNEDEK